MIEVLHHACEVTLTLNQDTILPDPQSACDYIVSTDEALAFLSELLKETPSNPQLKV